AGSVVRHLDLAADRAQAGDHRITPDLPATVGKHVGACLGGREQDVVDRFLVHAEPAQGVPEDAAHDRNAERLAPEHQAEFRVSHRLPSRLATTTTLTHSRSDSQLTRRKPYMQNSYERANGQFIPRAR